MATIVPQRRSGARPEDPDRQGRRAAPRAQLMLEGATEAIRGCSSVVLLDVSCTGARIEGRDLPETGKDIVLRCASLDAFGVIAWSAGDRRGIHFEDPLSVWEVSALAAHSDAIANSPMTADEIRAAADWENGLAR
jgi:hypothetical protein